MVILVDSFRKVGGKPKSENLMLCFFYVQCLYIYDIIYLC